MTTALLSYTTSGDTTHYTPHSARPVIVGTNPAPAAAPTMAEQTGRPKIERGHLPPSATAFVKADPNLLLARIGQWRTNKHVLPPLARTNSRALSVKPGNPARLIEKEAIMAKKPVKTASRARSAKSSTVKPTLTAETKVSKQNIVLTMLRRANGASVAEVIEATGWQPHSVRGFFSGALKKRLRIDVVSEKDANTGERRYHVAALKA